MDLFEDKIEAAKNWVAKRYVPEGDKDISNLRRWLEAEVKPYTQYPAKESVAISEENRVRLLVWEGTPMKGYIIIDYGRGLIVAIDYAGQQKVF